MPAFDYRVETTLEDGVFKHGKLLVETEGTKYEIPLPVKTTPVKKITSNYETYPEFKLVNEVFHTIDAVDLRNAIYEDSPSFIDDIKLKQKFSDSGELDIVLLNYSETKPMTGLEAQEYVRAVDEVSDIISCPLQFPLLHALVDGEDADRIDDPFHNFKHTKENFLEEVEALDPQKPVMGTLSFMSDGRLTETIQLYDDFDVEMIGVDFYRENPTTVSDVGLGDVIGRLTALDLFDGTPLFAYNMNKSPFRSNSKIRRAENFAPVGMAFDILGGNHLGLEFPPSGDQQNFTVFDPDVAGYRRVPVSSVTEEWPVTIQSNIPPEKIASLQVDTANNLVSLINAEQIQMSLSGLRTRLEQGNQANFLKMKNGIDQTMQDAFEAVSKSYSGGSGPDFNDY